MVVVGELGRSPSGVGEITMPHTPYQDDRCTRYDTAPNSEPTTVEWEGGSGDVWTVEVDPYAGAIRVNGREFDVSVLINDDVDPRMYRAVEK